MGLNVRWFIAFSFLPVPVALIILQARGKRISKKDELEMSGNRSDIVHCQTSPHVLIAALQG
jgi:hypothetical protein